MAVKDKAGKPSGIGLKSIAHTVDKQSLVSCKAMLFLS